MGRASLATREEVEVVMGSDSVASSSGQNCNGLMLGGGGSTDIDDVEVDIDTGLDL